MQASTIPPVFKLNRIDKDEKKNSKRQKNIKILKDDYLKCITYSIKKIKDKITINENEEYNKVQLEEEEKIIENNMKYYEDKTFEETVNFILDIINKYEHRFSFRSFDKMIEEIYTSQSSDYFISRILTNPFELITITRSPITFKQAYDIMIELKIKISDELFIDKWCIDTLNNNNGSFYKVKGKKEQDKYKNYTSSNCFTKTWNGVLWKFCLEKKIPKETYFAYLKILDKILIEHTDYKGVYGIEKYIEIEKKIGDDLLDLYHEKIYTIDDNKLNNIIEDYERKKGFKLNNEQLNAIKTSITNKFSIIEGPPGTGKSTITEVIIEWYNQSGLEISLAAPTGKAIKGLLNNCKNISDRNKCGTIHKCIYNTFVKIRREKVFNKIHKIIVDEASMIDIFIFQSLIAWCKIFNCGLILCGDIDQLPPVGMGRPFECIIKSNIFVDNITNLIEIKRQDKGKLKDCILNIKKRNLTESDFDNKSTIFIDHDFNDEKKTIDMFNDIIKTEGKDDIAIITPQKQEKAGVNEMNILLQQNVFNQNEIDIVGNFKNKDLIMRTENKYTDDDIKVNGECGRIYMENDKEEAQIIYEFSAKNLSPEQFEEERKKNTEVIPKEKVFRILMLNYCNTVHKYQGSQKPIVVFICSGQHSASLSWGSNRLKLVYTAISRAQKKLYVIGDKQVFFNVQKYQDEPFVSSFMSEFITYEL
jgi:hypothetical protein